MSAYFFSVRIHNRKKVTMRSIFVKFLLLLLLLVPCLFSSELVAQASTQDSTLVRVELLDGTRLVGSITAEDGTTVTIKLRSGSVLSFDKTEIKNIKPISGEIKDGQFRRLDPNTSRLAFGPTGRPVKKGEGYVSFNYLFFPLVAYGVSDRFTATVGVSIVPFTPAQLVYAAPKFAIIKEEKFQAAIGFFGVTVVGEGFSDFPNLSLFYGSTTLGSEYSAATIGLGWGRVSDGDDESQWADRPLILIGFEHQVSNSLKLISENYIIPGVEGALVSGGLRFFGEKLSSDVLLVTPTSTWGDASFPIIPYFGFAYNFGR